MAALRHSFRRRTALSGLVNTGQDNRLSQILAALAMQNCASMITVQLDKHSAASAIRPNAMKGLGDGRHGHGRERG